MFNSINLGNVETVLSALFQASISKSELANSIVGYKSYSMVCNAPSKTLDTLTLSSTFFT